MKKPKFRLPDDNFMVQDNLFLPPSVAAGYEDFPPIGREFEDIERILADPIISQGIGLDLEFNSSTNKPSILGVSNRKETAGVPWDAELARQVVTTAERLNVPIVGHAVISADRPVLEGALGIEISLSLWRDTMIEHYLANADLCKTPAKEEDELDSGVSGYMNLWCMSSLYTDLPQWKICRGKACAGPCPLHNPWGYCAIDAFAGLESHFGLQEELRKKGIPEKLVLDLHELAEIAYLMQQKGIKIDREYVRSLETDFEKHKLEIFPVEQHNGKSVYKPFNPKSVKQVQEYFTAKGINLKETDKVAVKKALEKTAKGRGYTLETLEGADNLPEELDALHRLYQFKDAGKGLRSWFDDKYLDKAGFAHPRFIITGTSTGRLASANPNFQNISARGWGSQVRRALVPRESGLKFWDMDFSQLELRICLYLAGVDPRDIDKDAFVYLVSKSEGLFDQAAANMHMTGRDIAKSVSHGGNYLEGIKVMGDRELGSPRIKAEIDAGALRVYPNWHYRNGTVAFTGANLAERLFGDRSRENRKKALQIQEDIYFAKFPMIRQFQQKVTEDIDVRGAITSPIGRYLPLAGSPEDDAKIAVAFLGQGVGSDFVQEKMLRYRREKGIIFISQIHDALVHEVPLAYGLDEAREFYELMKDESQRLPGFVCPFKVKEGINWGQLTPLAV